jgi:M-phase inducer phosphatase 2
LNRYRHLRSLDRASNTYPALQYPEIYLLEGGYKAFFQEHMEYCEPPNYRLMVDPDFTAQYQNYRAQTKRSGNFIGETVGRRMKSRSRLEL